MITFKVPATSANLGPGFDCLGISFNLYNTFKIEKSASMLIDCPIKKYCSKDNLFNIAFTKTMKILNKKGSYHVNYKPTIPTCGGLGTSATVIIAGCKTANILYGHNKLSDKEIFDIATKIEGHPDNVAAAIFKGLTASIKLDNGKLIHKKFIVSNKLHFTLLCPDFTVSTEKARKILPKTYSKKDIVNTISHSILMVEALKSGDFELLKEVCKDYVHEPYRKKLIKDYDLIKKQVEKKGDAILLISGSGASLLCISNNKNFHKNLKLNSTKANWEIKSIKVLN